jgi:hypothetical protein
MAEEGDSGAKLTAHPTVEKLVGDNSGFSSGMTVRGYVGPSMSEDRVTVFPTLDDLSQSFELARADVLAVDDAPDSQLPNGGKVIWVKSDAVITRRNTKTAQQYVQMHKGRLSITMLRRLGDGDVCMTFDCQTCTSNCGINCTSSCEEGRRHRPIFGPVRFR